MEEEFRTYLSGRKAVPESIDRTISAVKDFENYLRNIDVELMEADLDMLTRYISDLMIEGRNSDERLVAIARYCRFVKKNDFFIHIAGLVNAVEVLPSIGKRLGELVGEDVRQRVFDGAELPPIGSPQDDYPHITQMIVQRMENELSPEKCREVLTWNHHNIPTEAFLGHRERFERADNIDKYLEDEHRRFIDEIARHLEEGKVWYEQEITPEVVEFVKADQEISVGERVGDLIYVTKMPFDPKRYLEERDPRMKRFYACHCPLARTAIRDGDNNISSTFCYCSAGFTKLVYDVIFGETVEIEMLESALAGAERCRFAVKIPVGKMK